MTFNPEKWLLVYLDVISVGADFRFDAMVEVKPTERET